MFKKEKAVHFLSFTFQNRKINPYQGDEQTTGLFPADKGMSELWSWEVAFQQWFPAYKPWWKAWYVTFCHELPIKFNTSLLVILIIR